MGAWGPAVFSDDTTCDIRDDYRAHLEDGLTDSEARDLVVMTYADTLADQGYLLWLALSAAQAALGRLDDDTRTRALEVIDHDIGLEMWELEGATALAKRKAALSKLRSTLVGPQKPRRVVRKPWAHVTELTPGDVIATTVEGRDAAVFRVSHVSVDRTGHVPRIRRLVWRGSTVPGPSHVAGLMTMPQPTSLLNRPATSYAALRPRRKDQDWRDVGFQVIGRVSLEVDDPTFSPRAYARWESIRSSLSVGD